MTDETTETPAALFKPNAVDIGMLLARRIFVMRGNHSEVHLTEPQLAAYLAIAVMKGRQ